MLSSQQNGKIFHFNCFRYKRKLSDSLVNDFYLKTKRKLKQLERLFNTKVFYLVLFYKLSIANPSIQLPFLPV